MPHTRTPPSSVEEILETATSDPEWISILERSPIPAGADYELDILKELNAASLPRIQAGLRANRPANVTEVEVYVDIPSTELKAEKGRNRVIIAYPSTAPDEKARFPVIVLFHGGGHTIGHPENELPLARRLVEKYQAVVVLPSYRLAPDHSFPASFNDAFETLKQVALDIAVLSDPDSVSNILPSSLAGKIDPENGLIVGGTSAGATIAASISHLYHRWRASSLDGPVPPPITGVIFACGSVMNANRVPSLYQPFFLAREQNERALPLDGDLYALFHDAVRPNFDSPIWASLDQHPELGRDRLGEDHVYLKESGARVYLQVCGQDMSRDDALIYEKVLREESDVETRMDLYSGFGHVFWGMGGGYTELDMSKKRMEDTIEGVGWLLRRRQRCDVF